MPSNHLILLLLLPSIFPIIRVFSNESALRIRWPKYWSFSFNISPSSKHPGLIFFRMDWLDLLGVQGTLKSLLQHNSSKELILWHSAFFILVLNVLKFFFFFCCRKVLKEICIGELNPNETVQATLEAQLLSKLNHPAIVKFHANFVEQDKFCIITEYCEVRLSFWFWSINKNLFHSKKVSVKRYLRSWMSQPQSE